MLKPVGKSSRHAYGNNNSLIGETLPTISLASSSCVLPLWSVAFCSGKRLRKCYSLPSQLSLSLFSLKLCVNPCSLQKHSTRSFQCIGLNVHGGSFHWNEQLLNSVVLHYNRKKCLLPRKICSNVHLMGLLPCTG